MSYLLGRPRPLRPPDVLLRSLTLLCQFPLPLRAVAILTWFLPDSHCPEVGLLLSLARFRHPAPWPVLLLVIGGVQPLSPLVVGVAPLLELVVNRLRWYWGLLKGDLRSDRRSPQSSLRQKGFVPFYDPPLVW